MAIRKLSGLMTATTRLSGPITVIRKLHGLIIITKEMHGIVIKISIKNLLKLRERRLILAIQQISLSFYPMDQCRRSPLPLSLSRARVYAR